RMQPLEEVEEAVPVAGIYADAVVLDPDADHSIARFGADSDLRGFAFGNEFERVPQKIGEALADQSAVAQDRQELALNGDGGRGCLKGRLFLDNFGHQFVEFDGAELHSGAENAAVGQHVLDERIETRAGVADLIEDTPGVRLKLA